MHLTLTSPELAAWPQGATESMTSGPNAQDGQGPSKIVRVLHHLEAGECPRMHSVAADCAGGGDCCPGYNDGYYSNGGYGGYASGGSNTCNNGYYSDSGAKLPDYYYQMNQQHQLRECVHAATRHAFHSLSHCCRKGRCTICSAMLGLGLRYGT